jgi:ribosomal protein S18 acetylase RimI-like enzyme
VAIDGVLCEIRPADDSELAFVCDSWVESFRRVSWARRVPREIYDAGMRAMIARTIDSSIVTVARSRGVVLGWACYDDAAIQYVYVKNRWRRLGIATALVRDAHRVARWWLPGPWDAFAESVGIVYKRGGT